MPRNNMQKSIQTRDIDEVASRFTQLFMEAQRNDTEVPGEAWPLRAELVRRLGPQGCTDTLKKAQEMYNLLMPPD